MPTACGNHTGADRLTGLPFWTGSPPGLPSDPGRLMICRDSERLETPLEQTLILPERRRQPRYPIRVSIVVRTIELGVEDLHSETFQGWTEDISTTGTRIVCPRVPLTGQCWINLRTRRLRKKWFEVAAVWSNGVVTTKGLRQRVGISFVNPLDHEELDRMLVARALAQLRATMPHHGERLRL